MSKIVIYNHGKDSAPWGEKTRIFAEIAERNEYLFESLDYTATLDPDKRVEQLLAQDLAVYDEIVLVGSSMGAYVATVAAQQIKPRALFLLAPAFYLPGYKQTEFNPCAEFIQVVHGWLDDVVNPDSAWKFCKTHNICLTLYNADHRLLSVIDQVGVQFELFLNSFSSPDIEK